MRRYFSKITVLLALGIPGLASCEALTQQKHPLDFLEPFVGVWLPHPDWQPRQPDPKIGSLVPLNLQWQGGRSWLRIEEGLRAGAGYTTSGIVVWNPATSRADFLAKQSDGNLVFEGHYEPIDDRTVRRVYDVIDPSGGIRRFRETMHLRQDGGMDWTTELEKDGVFQGVSGKPGPEFHAIRPRGVPEPALEDFAVLVGEWRPDPTRIPEKMVAWRQRHGITDGYVSFSWGTQRRWIVFGEHRQQSGEWRQEGSGLIAWDPRSRMVVYREHTDSGKTLEGTLERIDPLTIKRHYRVSHPDGSVTFWEDLWRWQAEKPSCFDWTTTRVAGGIREVREPYRVCRRQARMVDADAQEDETP